MEAELELTAEAIEEAWAEILKLEDIADDDGTVRTTAELAEQFKRCESTIRARMRTAIKAGKVERVRVRRPGGDGRMQLIPAYRLLDGRW